MPDTTTPHPFRLDGRVALVTGAARGLGLDMARALAQAGAQVLVNGRQVEAVALAVNAINATPGLSGQAHPAVFDITDPAATAHALEAIRQRWGGLHILGQQRGTTRPPLPG